MKARVFLGTAASAVRAQLQARAYGLRPRSVPALVLNHGSMTLRLSTKIDCVYFR